MTRRQRVSTFGRRVALAALATTAFACGLVSGPTDPGGDDGRSGR